MTNGYFFHPWWSGFFSNCYKSSSFILANFYSDIIVIGTGDNVVRLDEEIHREMRKRRIALEVQDTVRAFIIFVAV